jgi:hypothetical protein
MKTNPLILLLVLVLAGCAGPDMVITRDYAGPSKVPTSRMAAHMQYRGFAILRPADNRWFENYGDQQPLEALFRIEPLSETHTFYASVQNVRIATQPKSLEEFKKYIDAEQSRSSARNEVISFESTGTALQGQWCVKFKIKSWDKAAQQSNEPLLMTVTGFVVLHPSWERTTILAMYSERGKQEEIKGEMDKAGEDFLAGVIIESAPGVKI